MLLSGTLLTSDKQQIVYSCYKNNHPDVIIIAHGFYNSKDSVLLKELSRSLQGRYDIFMFDFRGHGKSSGLFTWTSKEDRDLKTVFNYLKGKYEKIGLISFSLGASISINVLSETNLINSFISVSALSDFEKIDYKFWELDWENDIAYNLFTQEGRKGKGVRPGPFWLKKRRPIESVKRIKIPVLYIHGDKDWVIKPWHSKVLYKNTDSKKELLIFKNGSHAEYLIRQSPDKFKNLIRAWFKKTL